MLKDFKITKVGIAVFIIMLTGIFFRILFYSYNHPFWNDECALALNIVDFNIINCFKSLNYGQAAPPLFLIISGIFSKIIPHIELALRFFPLISSIFSIFIFYDLSRHILNKKSTIFLALLLFCFNYRLIYYSQEFKQYSSDILVFLSILVSYFYLKLENINTKKFIAIGFIYASSIWLSFTSLLALFTVFIMLLIQNTKTYKKIIFLFIPVIISFIGFYFSQSHLSSSIFLHTYWKDGFINRNLSNLFSIFVNYFSYSFNSIFVFLFAIIGLCLKLLNIKNQKSIILLVPFTLAVVLSYASIYPLESRVSLYLIPIFILFTVQIIDYINIRNKTINYIFYSIIIFFIGFPIIINSIYRISFKDSDIENIVTPLMMANNLMGNNDILYIPDGSEISYNFYKTDFNFKNVIIEKNRINDSTEYLKTLDKLQKNKTYYYIFCHFPNKQERLNKIYLWAKNKKKFKIYADKYSNALIVFTQ